MIVNLLLYKPLAISATPQLIQNFTFLAKAWRRTIRAVGGYWLGSFRLFGADIGRQELIKWYEEYLGNYVRETTFALTSWEGLIYEMMLILDGVQYRRTLDKEWFHNKVKVLYRDAGEQADTGWSENTDSSDQYGEVQYIDAISEAVTAAATALRDTRLADFGFPRSRMVGGLEFGESRTTTTDSLQVTVAGYIATMNWRYRTSSIAATAVSTALEDLVDDSEFVVAGTVDTNSMNVDVDCVTPQRLWDAIETIIRQGDASGNRWVGGVYEDREFDYNQGASEVEYYIRNGLLINQAGSPVIPSLLKPDFILRNANAPAGGTPIGGNVWDDPRNAWITEVEFVAPDKLILKPAGFEDVQILQEQLR